MTTHDDPFFAGWAGMARTYCIRPTITVAEDCHAPDRCFFLDTSDDGDRRAAVAGRAAARGPAGARRGEPPGIADGSGQCLGPDGTCRTGDLVRRFVGAGAADRG